MAVSKSFWQRVSNIVVIIGVLVGIMIWYGRTSIMGTRFEVSKNESVNYSGDATEEDARKLGEALKTAGYFDGSKPVDVLLNRKEGKTTVSFVVGTNWNNPETLQAFEVMGAELAPSVGGMPLTVKLIDDKLNTQKEIAIQ